ncbi:hypothetical protein PRRG_00043 [Prochlorococcus phage P-RSP2]|nr:hypothetical protein PRRG_00043 [Prochlorococcus phage P-RSP2]
MSVIKVCKVCKKEKLLNEFHLNGTGTRPECKACQSIYLKQYNQIKKNRTPPKPGQACACCGKTDKKLTWDHDHKTLKERGWICHSCNLGIGKLGDNIEGVLKAYNYLIKNSTLK